VNEPSPSRPPPTTRRFFPLQPELLAPPLTRTRFAVNLQLGRSFSSVALLVRYGYEGHTDSARAEARLISSAILSGARDRSRDPHLRTLRDQQRRAAPLQRKRPARKKAAWVSLPVRKAAARTGDSKPSSTQRGRARLHDPGWLSVRRQQPRRAMGRPEPSDETRARAEQSYQVTA
jgi:hypothetical protein